MFSRHIPFAELGFVEELIFGRIKTAGIKFYDRLPGFYKLAGVVLSLRQCKFMNKSEFSEKRKKFNHKPVDELIGLLLSEDLRTRFFAEMSLRDLSGT